MNSSYIVRVYVHGTNIISRMPRLSEVDAPSAEKAKQMVREELVSENPNIQIKRITATPVQQEMK